MLRESNHAESTWLLRLLEVVIQDFEGCAILVCFANKALLKHSKSRKPNILRLITIIEC